MTSLALTVALQAVLLAAPEQDYSVAYQKSLDSGRPLVVLLGADWCPACLTMKNSILPKVSEQGGLKDVEFSYVDIDRQSKLAEVLARARSIPQLIRFERRPSGWISGVLLGAQSPEKVTSFVKGEAAEATAAETSPTPASNPPSVILGSLPAPITGSMAN